ncbi:cytochrome c [Dechloromonas sp. CZR5]|uniref:c-type cytochrome n=1 Tax=Dechloromonas sp. CZR5 TaxID=2608630 RepID=UPI00123D9F03|nr:cytochrome c [Dechloromonas sp. CZR5]
MTRNTTRALTTAVLLLLSGSVLAQQLPQLKPDEVIRYRKAGYAFMNWNMTKLKAMLDGSVPFNKDQALAAAASINSTVNSGMGALYTPGSDKDSGNEKTRLKSEFFTQPDKVKEVAGAYRIAGTKLAAAAATGDPSQIKPAFDEMGKACKGCHEAFRKD